MRCYPFLLTFLGFQASVLAISLSSPRSPDDTSTGTHHLSSRTLVPERPVYEPPTIVPTWKMKLSKIKAEKDLEQARKASKAQKATAREIRLAKLSAKFLQRLKILKEEQESRGKETAETESAETTNAASKIDDELSLRLAKLTERRKARHDFEIIKAKQKEKEREERERVESMEKAASKREFEAFLEEKALLHKAKLGEMKRLRKAERESARAIHKTLTAGREKARKARYKQERKERADRVASLVKNPSSKGGWSTTERWSDDKEGPSSNNGEGSTQEHVPGILPLDDMVFDDRALWDFVNS